MTLFDHEKSAEYRLLVKAQRASDKFEKISDEEHEERLDSIDDRLKSLEDRQKRRFIYAMLLNLGIVVFKIVGHKIKDYLVEFVMRIPD